MLRKKTPEEKAQQKEKVQEQAFKAGESINNALGINSGLQKLEKWGKQNPRKAFIIPIIILSIGLIIMVLSLVFSPKEEYRLKDDIPIVIDKPGSKIYENPLMQLIKEEQREIELILMKDSLTVEDSLKVYHHIQMLEMLNDSINKLQGNSY